MATDAVTVSGIAVAQPATQPTGPVWRRWLWGVVAVGVGGLGVLVWQVEKGASDDDRTRD